MRNPRDRELERLQNHLLADECRETAGAEAYNTDSVDVDLEKYSQKAYGRKSGCGIWLVILLLTGATGVFLYLVWGGRLPWN